jgi:hypothetical protein
LPAKERPSSSREGETRKGARAAEGERERKRELAESEASEAAFFISIILGSAESDLYWSVGATFIQIID